MFWGVLWAALGASVFGSQPRSPLRHVGDVAALFQRVEAHDVAPQQAAARAAPVDLETVDVRQNADVGEAWVGGWMDDDDGWDCFVSLCFGLD